MFIVYEAAGNGCRIIGEFKSFKEAQDFLMNELEGDVDALIEDGYNYEEAWELASSYYRLEEV